MPKAGIPPVFRKVPTSFYLLRYPLLILIFGGIIPSNAPPLLLLVHVYQFSIFEHASPLSLGPASRLPSFFF